MSAASKSEVEDCDLRCLEYRQRLYHYCHTALLTVDERMMRYHFSLDRDGKLSGEGNFELVHAHLVVRHGDRSPVHPYTVGAPLRYECGLEDIGDNARWRRLEDFPKPQSLEWENKVTHYARYPIFPGGQSKGCGIGKLTRTGFYQHRGLGHQMWKKYSRPLYLRNLSDQALVESMYVQSTDTSRTIRSAAAFLLGFLPDRKSLRKQVTIHVSPDIRLEAPPPGVAPVLHSCKHYWAFHDAQVREKTDYFQVERTKHPLFERLNSMFALELDNQPIIHKVFDSVRTRGCHNSSHPLPCSGAGRCIDYKFANKLFEFSDWAFARHCSENESLVGLLPFLRHSMLALMEQVVTQDRESAKRLVLSFAHDNIMTFLLMSLGVRLDGQMPYASRIAFELWRDKGAARTAGKAAYYVRVLFNGFPVTHRLNAWRTGELLAYSDLEKYLTTGPYRDTQSHSKVCGNL